MSVREGKWYSIYVRQMLRLCDMIGTAPTYLMVMICFLSATTMQNLEIFVMHERFILQALDL